MPTTPPRVRAALLAVAIAIGACNDDIAAGPSTTSVDRTTTTTSPTSAPERPRACDPVELPSGASEVAEASADVDGDGDTDRARTYRVHAAEWRVQVDLAAGGGADAAMATFSDSVTVLGGADVDGDGAEELWARTGAGAAATIVGLAHLTGCDLSQVTFETGDPVAFPVGGTVGATAGLACDARLDPASDLTAYTATNTGEDRYELTAVEYALDGSVLRETAREVASVTTSDAEFARATSFTCGVLGL